MDFIFMGYTAIAIGIFLGFIGIAALFFGLRAFRTDIKGELSTYSLVCERSEQISRVNYPLSRRKL
jgi:hypothetical protein